MDDSITGQLKQICESANKNICALAKRHAESGSEEEREKFEQEEILDSYRVVKIFGCTSPASKDNQVLMETALRFTLGGPTCGYYWESGYGWSARGYWGSKSEISHITDETACKFLDYYKEIID